MFPERLQRARKAASCSLRDLAAELGVSHSTISKYEKGELVPSSAQLLALAKTLGVRTEYFFRPMDVKLEGVEYRKRAATPKKLLQRINADVLDQAERWEELLSLYPQRPVPEFSLDTGMPRSISSAEHVEQLAVFMRSAWDLGLNPIPDMIDTLESNGFMVIVTGADDGAKFDGLAGKIGETPVVVVSENWPGDRQRFTLAHELAHVLLEGRLASHMDEEKSCNQFAGAFLLPRDALHQHVGDHRHAIEPRELQILKAEFGISMMGVLIRSFQCEVITEYQKRQYMKLFSARGWRKKEPGEPYPAEKTYLFQQLAYRALAEDYIGESKAAELLGVSLAAFHKERRLGLGDAAFNQ